MRRAFVDHEYLVPIALLAIVLAICLPILKWMRASPWLCILSVALVCALFIVPWVLSERAGRREMDRLMSKKDPPREDDADPPLD